MKRRVSFVWVDDSVTSMAVEVLDPELFVDFDVRDVQMHVCECHARRIEGRQANSIRRHFESLCAQQVRWIDFRCPPGGQKRSQ